MTPGQLLIEGFELMLFGMGLVFVFLVLLIGCIRFMSALLQRMPAHHDGAIAVMAQPLTGNDQPDADTLAAIQLALRQHRNH